MVFGQLGTYKRRFYQFSSADFDGAAVLGADFLRAVLRYGQCEGVHVFADTYAQFKRTLGEGQWSELQREFGPDSFDLKSAFSLPQCLKHHDYVFGLSGIELQPLAQIRRALGVNYPICAFLSALDSPFLLPLYCSAALLARPNDAFVAPSRAGLETVRTLAVEANALIADHMSAPRHLSLRTEMIPHGVDHEFLTPRKCSAARELLGIPKDHIVLLYLGRLSEQLKADLEPLLIAFNHLRRKHPRIVLLVAGQDVEGEYSKRLMACAQELGVVASVMFVVNFPFFTKPALYNAADIFVSPVDNVQETFGLSILEAMSSGLPVVASDWSGYRDLVVSGETGFLVPTLWDSAGATDISGVASVLNPGVRRQALADRTIVDVKELTSALETLIQNADLRNRMGDAGRRRVLENFTWADVIRRYRCLWQDLLEASNRTPVDHRERPLQDYNKLFAHFASKVLSADDVVRVSEIGRAWALAKPENRKTLPTKAGAALMRLSSQAEEDKSIGELLREKDVTKASLLLLLKKGYLETA